MRQGLNIACQKKVVHTAIRLALIVGPLLVLINHGDTIIAGEMQPSDWLKSALTMLVPYTVSTLSSVSAYRCCQAISKP
ncbi:MAG: nitrate/nitrite transporter NrtS [Mariprofundaceae bacterium]